MTTIAIIGAGPGLGQAAASRFGAEGFTVCLISRNQTNVNERAAELTSMGITARGYAADVRDPQALRAALDAAAADLGTIEVLQYSPAPAKDMRGLIKPVLETTAEDLVGPVEQSVYGSATAVQQVLPGLYELGHGTIIFVSGGSAVKPNGNLTGISVAFAAEHAYARMLHDALVPKGIHVAQVIIPDMIGGGDPDHEPDAIAERIWSAHSTRSGFQTIIGSDGA